MTVDELLPFVTFRGEPLSEAAVKAFEKELGVELPADYRAFLKACNGGYLAGRFWYRPPDEKEPGWRDGPYGTEAGLDHVYGLRDDEAHFDLRSTMEAYDFASDQPRMPREVIPIADDPFGNGICLVIKGPRRGEIVFWDHEDEPDPDEWDGSLEAAENVSRVCGSFSALIERLGKDSSDDEDEGYRDQEREDKARKAALANIPTAPRPTLYSELAAFRDQLAAELKTADPFDCPAIDLTLVPPVDAGTKKKRTRFPVEPLNTDTFAMCREPAGFMGTPGLVVFGFLYAEGLDPQDPPVVASFPNSPGVESWSSVVVGENLREFLCLGSRTGYAALEQLYYVPIAMPEFPGGAGLTGGMMKLVMGMEQGPGETRRQGNTPEHHREAAGDDRVPAQRRRWGPAEAAGGAVLAHPLAERRPAAPGVGRQVLSLPGVGRRRRRLDDARAVVPTDRRAVCSSHESYTRHQRRLRDRALHRPRAAHGGVLHRRARAHAAAAADSAIDGLPRFTRINAAGGRPVVLATERADRAAPRHGRCGAHRPAHRQLGLRRLAVATDREGRGDRA